MGLMSIARDIGERLIEMSKQRKIEHEARMTTANAVREQELIRQRTDELVELQDDDAKLTKAQVKRGAEMQEATTERQSRQISLQRNEKEQESVMEARKIEADATLTTAYIEANATKAALTEKLDAMRDLLVALEAAAASAPAAAAVTTGTSRTRCATSTPTTSPS